MRTAGIWYLIVKLHIFPDIYFALTKICNDMNLLYIHYAYYIIMGRVIDLNRRIDILHRESGPKKA